jgi:hypothetical protein
MKAAKKKLRPAPKGNPIQMIRDASAKKPVKGSNLPKTGKTSPNVPVQSRITDQLKKIATQLIESIGKMDYDEESINTCDVTVDCKDSGQVDAIAAYCRAQERFILENLPPPPSGWLQEGRNTEPLRASKTEQVRPKPDTEGTKGHCTVKNLHAAYLGLEELANNIAQTRRSSLPTNEKLLAIFGQFTDAFSEIIGFTVYSEKHPSRRHEQEAAIKHVHHCALTFTSAFKKASVTQPSARITIDHDLSVRIGETAKDFGVTVKRQLFSLAYLRDREDFSLNEYSGLYGNDSAEKRKEFDQNNRKLADALGLPHRFWKATRGRRTIDCIEWNINASQEDLAEFLKKNATRQDKWSLPGQNTAT